ncbi:hypothetical protein L1987_73050 [Smallanthus sonchifolius]|uniref:Uncharacterized protein n=1 Tax=Smallanthus sonchifolius TaxID=185202 RepID=A0ACB9AXA4_9ASTR|nr:hypothetical protein L1987_73050 [Smallanthus sonchifolius]
MAVSRVGRESLLDHDLHRIRHTWEAHLCCHTLRIFFDYQSLYMHLDREGWYLGGKGLGVKATKMNDNCEFSAGQGVGNGGLAWLLLLNVYLFCRWLMEFSKRGQCIRGEACLAQSSTGFGWEVRRGGTWKGLRELIPNTRHSTLGF